MMSNHPKVLILIVMVVFYRLSQTADGTETTLLPIDRPVPDGEQVILTFKAKDFDEARAMANQFLGFV